MIDSTARAAYEIFTKAVCDFGATHEKATEIVCEIAKNIPPISEQDIILVWMNPSLNVFQKQQITRSMERTIRNERRHDRTRD